MVKEVERIFLASTYQTLFNGLLALRSKWLGAGEGLDILGYGAVLCVYVDAHNVSRHSSCPCMQEWLHRMMHGKGPLEHETWGRSQCTSLNWNINKDLKVKKLHTD